MGAYIVNVGDIWKSAIINRSRVPDAMSAWFLRRTTQHVVRYQYKAFDVLHGAPPFDDLMLHLEHLEQDLTDAQVSGSDAAWEWIEVGGYGPELRPVITDADTVLLRAAHVKDAADIAAARAAGEQPILVRVVPVMRNVNLDDVILWLRHLDQSDPQMAAKLYKLTWSQAVQHAQKWWTAFERQIQRNARAEIRRLGADNVAFIMDVENGHKWVRLLSDSALRYEGNCMRNCLQDADKDDYVGSEIYSLRNAENVSRVTVEVALEYPKGASRNFFVKQIKGWCNTEPAVRYRPAIKALIEMLKLTYVCDANMVDAIYQDGKLLFRGTPDYEAYEAAPRASVKDPSAERWSRDVVEIVFGRQGQPLRYVDRSGFYESPDMDEAATVAWRRTFTTLNENLTRLAALQAELPDPSFRLPGITMAPDGNPERDTSRAWSILRVTTVGGGGGSSGSDEGAGHQQHDDPRFPLFPAGLQGTFNLAPGDQQRVYGYLDEFTRDEIDDDVGRWLVASPEPASIDILKRKQPHRVEPWRLRGHRPR